MFAHLYLYSNLTYCLLLNPSHSVQVKP